MTWLLDGREEVPPGARLRALIESGETVAVPGAFSPLVARLAWRLGFRALYLSGAGLSASLGIPDLGLFTLDELVQAVRWTVRASPLPLIVDADTGFGEALNVARAVRELEEAGAGAVQIEDQVLPKRCGHLEGKQVVPAEAFAEKVASARRARRHALIVARTDARGVLGFDEAVRRARIYLEAGADVIFPEALESEEEFAEFARRVDAPLLANMTEFGRSPLLPLSRLAEMGYRLVLFPVSALRVAMRAVEDFLRDLAETGSQEGWLERMQTRAQLYDLIDYARYEEHDRAVAEEAREALRRKEEV